MVALPSVTRILQSVGLGPDFSKVPPAALEAARARGSAVHAAIEAHHYQYEVELEDRWKPYLSAYERFLVETGHTPIITEAAVTSEAWKVIGHIDRVGWTAGARGIIDFKTAESLELKPVTYQLAGYWMLWNETHPKEQVKWAGALQLKRDGTYRWHPLEVAKHVHVFQAAVIVTHARGDMRDADERDRYLD